MKIAKNAQEYRERKRAMQEKHEIETQLSIVHIDSMNCFNVEIWILAELQIIFVQDFQCDEIKSNEHHIFLYKNGECFGVFAKDHYNTIRHPKDIKI